MQVLPPSALTQGLSNWKCTQFLAVRSRPSVPRLYVDQTVQSLLNTAVSARFVVCIVLIGHALLGRCNRRAYTYRHHRACLRSSSEHDNGGVPELLDHYDPSSFQVYFSSRPIQVLQRCVNIAWQAGGWLLDFSNNRSESGAAKRLAQDLRRVLTDLGPSFVKLGQVLSSRVDLIPYEFVRELKTLTDQVDPFPVEMASEILERDWASLDAPINPRDLPSKPIAAASLGQVYRIETKSGQILAVKIQRPRVREQICLDLYVLRSLAPGVKQYLGLNTDLVALVDEYGSRFIQELDYIAEAENAEQFQETLNLIGMDSVFVAEPVRSLTTGRVLVTEWVDGERIDKDKNPENARLCGLALTAHLIMLLDTGRLHADPHPGNLLCTPEGRLCILDWGLVTSVGVLEQDAIISFFMHILAEDYAAIPADLVLLGFIAEGSEKAIQDEVVIRAISGVFKGLASGGAAQRRIGDVIPDIQRLRQKYGNIGQIPAYFAYILRAFSVLEGIGLDQNPEYAIVSDCYPYLVSRLLREDEPRSKQVLEALIYGSSPTAGEPRPALAAKRVVKLLGALKTYMEQSGALGTSNAKNVGRTGSTPHEEDNRTLKDIMLLLRRLSRLKAIQEVLVDELARTLDVVTREVAEAAMPPPLSSLAPRRTSEDEAVLEALRDIAGALQESSLITDVAVMRILRQFNEMTSEQLFSRGAMVVSEIVRDLPAVRSKVAFVSLRLAAALIERIVARL